MAENAIFHSRVSSRRSPIPLLSSETKARDASRHLLGLLRGMGLPSNSTLPPASQSPMIPFGMPSLPCPASPPMPRISPSLISRSTLRTVSPDISTHRLRMDMMFFASGLILISALAVDWIFLPTIHFVISATSVSFAGTSFTT